MVAGESSTIVEKFLNRPIPVELWHYTTLAGFMGIVTSGDIWATEAHFTKDRTEFVHALSIAEGILKEMPSADESQQFAKTAILKTISSSFHNGSLSQGKMDIYLASFSESKDLKSQWNEFSENGTGVSIAFDLRNERPPFGMKSAATMAPCIYEATIKKIIIEAALNDFVTTCAELHRKTTDPSWVPARWSEWVQAQRTLGIEPDDEGFKSEISEGLKKQLEGAATQSTFDFLRLASHCKHDAFREENEWRIALPYFRNTPMLNNKVLFRGTKNDIPYVTKRLSAPGELMPITQVMVGFNCSKECEERVNQGLSELGYRVQVTRSAIPLRSSH